MATVQMAVRLPEDQVRRIDELVPGQYESRSELVRRAVEQYLYRLACERDAAIYAARPLTDQELSLADDPEAWRSTPAW